MPRNNQGVMLKPNGTTAVANTIIKSSKFNEVIDDIIVDSNAPRPISAGGTGASTLAQAKQNLEIVDSANKVDNFLNITAMRAAVAPTLGRAAYLLGGAAINDNLNGLFFYDPLSILLDNSVDVIKPNSIVHPAPGRYIRAKTALASGDVSFALQKDSPRFDRAYMRNVPSVAVWEPWAMAPDLISWVDASGNRARVTENSIRERVRSEKRMGVRAIWLKYVEIFGHWFTKPNFTRWDDRDNAPGVLTAAKYWHQFPNNLNESLADDFDFVAVVIDECARNGMQCIIGLGRVGLFKLLEFYQTGTNGYTGAAALTQSAMMQLAIDRTRQLHNDIVTRFEPYRDFILALSPGFEPSDMPTWKVFSTGVTSGAGSAPHVKSAGYQWWVTPAQMAQLPTTGATLAARGSFAQDIIDCGADVWIVQDAVGAGNDYTLARYSYVSSVTLSQLDEIYARWKRSLNDAGRAFGTILEHWRMGSEPTTNLTLSALSGASITATSAFPFFNSGMVGQYITGAVGGNARIAGFNSSTSITLDTTTAATLTSAAGAAFLSLSLPQGSFSLNTGYANPYPASPSRIAQQVAIHAKYSDELCMYGTSSFTVDDTLGVLLPQTLAGQIDYRTKAKALFDDTVARFKNGLTRLRGGREKLPIRRVFQGSSITPSGGSYTVVQDRYTPTESFSKILLRLRLTVFRGKTVSAFVNDIAIRLQVNGTNVGPLAFTGGENGVCNGVIEILYSVPNFGIPFNFGMSLIWQTPSGDPTISDIDWVVEEFL